MSEEILQALIQLFAILSRQGGQVSAQKLKYFRFFLQSTVFDTEVEKYYAQFVEHLDVGNKKLSEKGYKTAPIDSVDILAICYRINATLKQDQKIIVLLRCIELFKDDDPLSARDEILATCAEVFNIPRNEYESLKHYVENDSLSEFTDENNLVILDKRKRTAANKHVLYRKLNTSVLIVLRVHTVNLFFIRILGSKRLVLNGVVMSADNIYIFPPGSIVKIPSDAAVYYSDILQVFQEKVIWQRIHFEAKKVSLQFNEDTFGIHSMSFSEGEGKLVGILGGSGSGKTTLLTVFSGLKEPTQGKVLLNGVDIRDPKAKDQIGYVSQDDLLVEELTVFENLYYNSRLIFGDLSREKITEKVDEVLKQLGLFEARNLKVGSVHEKVLSGGQRKRLNMGLEIIRNPLVLFLDEPTSGLSSKDSENVMLLLAELRQKGHLLFVVIHQPSSNIYKLFDTVILMDQGGYCVYKGNPIEALSYFKSRGNKLSKDITHCSVCGTVNAQEIFDIIEEKIVNEYGIETFVRKVTPERWYGLFAENWQQEIKGYIKSDTEKVEEPVKEEKTKTALPKVIIHKPSRFRQWLTYLQRDLSSKLADRLYMLLLVIEPLILSFILAFVIKRATGSDVESYVFMKNENIPAYIFMSIIVMIFIGMTMSAEEIFNDRKILKREHFLGLSKMSYLLSKVFILLVLTAFQSFLFVWAGNSILELNDNLFHFWLMVFTIAFNANLIGLNISGTFRSAVTIYILIPLLIIPQMILGGAMFDYEKLNRHFEDEGYAPFFVSIIPSRWAYEGLMVEQYVNNRYEKLFYDHNQAISSYMYKNGPYISKLYKLVDESLEMKSAGNTGDEYLRNLALIHTELEEETAGIPAIPMIDYEGPGSFDEAYVLRLKQLLTDISEYYQFKYNEERLRKDITINNFIRNSPHPDALDEFKNKYHNRKIEMLVKRELSDASVVEKNGRLERIFEPVYIQKEVLTGTFRKYPYFSATKYFAGKKIPTYWYNLFILWGLNLIFFMTLYWDVLRKMLRMFK